MGIAWARTAHVAMEGEKEMNRDDLKDLVRRIYEPAIHMLDSSIGLPRVMNSAAIEFLVNQPEETADHIEMRHQMRYLENHGHFDLVKNKE